MCRSIRRRRDLAATHVIAFLAGERAGATEALEAGADDYLPTPFERAELDARLRMGLRATQLRASEVRLWALIANVPGAIYRCANDADWTMELLSEEIERICGYPPTDFMQNSCRSFASVIHPDDRDDVARSVAQAIEEERPFALEYRMVRADDYLTTPFERAALDARLRMGLRATQLRASEARLWALIANVPGAIYRCANDADWTMELISEEIERICGYPPTDFMQNACRSFASIIHPDDRDDVARSVAEAIEEEGPFALEYRIVRADGQVAWVLERGQLVHGNDGRVWLDGAIFDVTERRRAEEALREREAERARLDEVRASRARIVEAADAARRRLERDLHDGAQQQLVALALNLRLARGQAEADPEATAKLLDEALADAERAREDLRELARGLHPAVLTDRGLVPALQLLADRAPLPVELSAELPAGLTGPVEIATYFVVSEALTNVVKHASAGHVRVSVTTRNGDACVEVADDGVGGAEPSTESGLSGLADRVGALDGRLEIESPSGGGTRVRAVIPCA